MKKTNPQTRKAGTQKQKPQNTKRKTPADTKANQKKEHQPGKEAPKEKQPKNKDEISLSPKLIIIALIIAVSALYFYQYSPATDTANPTDTNTVQRGDKVHIRFTQKLENGTIIDTNYETIAKQEGIINDSYPALIFIVGQGRVPKGLEDALIGMKPGNKKTIKLYPKDAYGEYKHELVGIAERIQHKEINITVVTTESLTSKKFTEIFKKKVAIPGNTVSTPKTPWNYTITDIKSDNITLKAQISKGDTYALPDIQLWNSTAIQIKDNEAIFQQNPENGTIVPTQLGNATVTTTKDHITLTINPKIGDVYFLDNMPAKVTKLNSTHITLDANHPLAGKTIIFDIELLQRTITTTY